MTTSAVSGPRTLTVDCGGTGLKALVLDEAGVPITERVRVRTPYPCPPDLLIDAVVQLAKSTGEPFDRVSVGFPGMIRDGVVRSTPHYITEAGPFTPVREDLRRLWTGFDVRAGLEEALGRPTRVLNDAEIAGRSVVTGHGFEVMLTLGTGVGAAFFDEGRLLPKVELSQAPFRRGETYDQQLGHHARRALGDRRWSRRVRKAIDGLRPVLGWDHLYVGGGGARHLTEDLGHDVSLVSNENGLLGGIRLWDSE